VLLHSPASAEREIAADAEGPETWCHKDLEPPGDSLEPALDIEDGIHVPAGVEEANFPRRGEVREPTTTRLGSTGPAMFRSEALGRDVTSAG